MKVLLIGANGRTGRHVARQLRAASLPFKVLLRKSAQRGEFAALGAQIVLGDLTHHFSHAFDDVTHVVYAAGSAESEGVNEERAIDRDAVQRTADYAKRRRTQQLVVISAISAYWPESSTLQLKHYSKMKREADDYVQASGVPYVILRPGALSDETGRGTIALATDRNASTLQVSRDDVARVTVACITRGVRDEVIGFVGGDTPIDVALDTVQTAPTSR
ncbi:SDR family oxidoreductase [Caballeronia sordidicola]|uniref:Oxidoreductase ylbE n=1 Tax=Caballeronia sordidicola TaxID=196367 RepID=A0A242NAN7_CABSO|nr:SDR family oxidoreductase [Caballeronia sordidicola]OTP80804.1 oxidoreductase ylbE [Caballeronia sordidicola]